MDSPTAAQEANAKTKLFRRRLKRVASSDEEDNAARDKGNDALRQSLMAKANAAKEQNDEAKQENLGTASSSKQTGKPGSDASDGQEAGDQDAPRRFRRIRRMPLQDLEQQYGAGSAASNQGQSDSDASARASDEGEYQPLEKKIKKMKKRINGKKKDDWAPDQVVISDEDSEVATRKKAPKRRSTKRDGDEAPARKKKAPQPRGANDDFGNKMNMVKTSNKLIGEIANNDLYASDEGLLNDGFGAPGHRGHGVDDLDYRHQALELDFAGTNVATGAGENAPKNAKFLNKMKTKRELELQNQGVEQDVVNLGFVQNIAQKVSANQLAASGIQISVRDKLMAHLKSIDTANITSKEQNLLSALESSQGQDKEAKEVQAGPSEQIQQKVATEPKNDNQIDSSSIPKDQQQEKKSEHDSEDSESGLLFYDPQAEALEKKHKELVEMQRNRMNLQKDRKGQKSAAGQMAFQQSLVSTGEVNQRGQFLQQLKLAQKQKQSRNITLESVKQTFQATDFDSRPKKGQKAGRAGSKVDADGQAVEESDDSDYDPDAAQKEVDEDQALLAADEGMWDDEENLIAEGAAEDADDQESGSEKEDVEKTAKSVTFSEDQDMDLKDMEDKLSVTESQVSKVLSKRSQAGDEGDGQSEGPRRLKRNHKTNKDSDKLSNHSSVRRQNKQKSSQHSARLKNFFDDEAELGSDDEENDDIKKLINKNDAEEDEDGLDEDLKEFVVQADDVEVGEAEQEALIKYQLDLEQDDKNQTRRVMEAAIFGQNRKRKRGEVEGGLGDDSDLDDFQKRKQERLQEREQMLNSQDDMEELEQHLLEGGKGRALEHLRNKQLIEDEELSDDEIQKQVENSKYYTFMRNKQKENQLKSFEQREKEMEDEIGGFLVDLNKADKDQKQLKRANTLGEHASTIAAQNNIANDSTAANSSGANSKTSKSSLVQKGMHRSGNLQAQLHRMGTTVGSMLNKKKVTPPHPGMNKDLNMKKLQSSPSRMQAQPENANTGKSPKKSYVGGGSMLKFFKQTPGKQADKANGAAAKGSGAVPMLFKQRKANI